MRGKRGEGKDEVKVMDGGKKSSEEVGRVISFYNNCTQNNRMREREGEKKNRPQARHQEYIEIIYRAI